MSITVYHKKKKIRAPDGTWRALTTYDGKVWQMDALKARARFNRTAARHPKFAEKAISNLMPQGTTTERPVFFPVTHIGARKAGGSPKKQRDRRNLKRR